MNQVEKLAIINSNPKVRKFWKLSLIFASLNLLLIVIWSYMILSDSNFGSFVTAVVISSLILQIVILKGIYKSKEWVTIWLWFQFVLILMSINFFAPILNIAALITYKIFLNRLKRHTRDIGLEGSNKKSKKILKIIGLIFISFIILIVSAYFLLRTFTGFFGASYLEVRENYKLLEVGDNSLTEEVVGNFLTGEGVKDFFPYGETMIIRTRPTEKGRVFFTQSDFNHNDSFVTIAINNKQRIYQFSDSYINLEPEVSAMSFGVGVFNVKGEEITYCGGGQPRGSSFCDFFKTQVDQDDIDSAKLIWRNYLDKNDFKEGEIASSEWFPFP